MKQTFVGDIIQLRANPIHVILFCEHFRLQTGATERQVNDDRKGGEWMYTGMEWFLFSGLFKCSPFWQYPQNEVLL